MVTIRRSGTTEDSRFSSSISCSNIAVLPARAAFSMASASGPIEFWTELLIAGCDRAHNAVVTYHQGQGDKPGLRRHQNGTRPHTMSGLHMIPGCPYPGVSANRFTQADFRSIITAARPPRHAHAARGKTCAYMRPRSGRPSSPHSRKCNEGRARNQILPKKKRSGPLGAFRTAPTSIP
jgi:hypothetical protein